MAVEQESSEMEDSADGIIVLADRFRPEIPLTDVTQELHPVQPAKIDTRDLVVQAAHKVARTGIFRGFDLEEGLNVVLTRVDGYPQKDGKPLTRQVTIAEIPVVTKKTSSTVISAIPHVYQGPEDSSQSPKHLFVEDFARMISERNPAVLSVEILENVPKKQAIRKLGEAIRVSVNQVMRYGQAETKSSTRRR